MLGLFQENQTELPLPDLKIRAREILISALNKGRIPTLEEYKQELPLMESSRMELICENFLRLTRWEFLNDVLRETATEYYLHSPEASQRLGLDGCKTDLKVALDEADWQLWLEIMALHFHQNWNVQNPFVSFYADLFGRSYRLSLIHGSTSPGKRSKLMIRSISRSPFHVSSFGQEQILLGLVEAKKNFLVAGSTGSGKTSLLSALVGHVDPLEHLIILEDTFEIMSSHPHETRFLAGQTTETSLKSYLTYSMRLSPDRLILGEMRSHEVVPFLMAMNTGHKGLMGTIHASSAVDAINRVALLFSIYGGEGGIDYEKVMGLICRNVEYVVFMENKKVKEVIRILGADRGQPFFESVVSLV